MSYKDTVLQNREVQVGLMINPGSELMVLLVVLNYTLGLYIDTWFSITENCNQLFSIGMTK